ncbi:hypothetical protein [Polaromonas sp.]|uniref:hypothetical protein n=1 Tax=Polaromonas sp. TaxID=1869339 RepID=UPI0017E6A48A|nr:hypothetical protein [Polaromonas sp.]NMM06712.1 hypothetical protein [Polaromonas sp.]
MFYFLIGMLCLLLALSAFILKSAGFRFLGENAHPLSLVILLQILFFTLPGTIAIGVLDFPMSFDMDMDISQSAKEYAVISTILSIILFFLGLAFLFKSRILSPLYYRAQDEKISTLKWLTFVSLIILAIKLASISEIPLLLAFSGDIVAAGEAKVRILTNQEGITVFGLNYIFRSFTSYVYLASVMLLSYDPKNSVKRAIFIANIPLALINSLYDIQKFTIVLLVVSTFWLFYIRGGRAKYLIRGGLLGFGLSAVMFVITLGYEFDMALVQDTLLRIFAGQNEGMFYIYQFLTPDEKYLWLGMPLAGLFGLQQIDPAAEVVQILFPTAGDAWLNANTYYLAHAWTIFGTWSIILGPLFVLFNITVVLNIARPFVAKNPTIYYPVIFWLIIRVPIVNNYSDFLWFKVVLDFAINFGFVFVVDYLSRSNFAIQQPEKK